MLCIWFPHLLISLGLSPLLVLSPSFVDFHFFPAQAQYTRRLFSDIFSRNSLLHLNSLFCFCPSLLTDPISRNSPFWFLFQDSPQMAPLPSFANRSEPAQRSFFLVHRLAWQKLPPFRLSFFSVSFFTGHPPNKSYPFPQYSTRSFCFVTLPVGGAGKHVTSSFFGLILELICDP